jgi:hypothetical protein
MQANRDSFSVVLPTYSFLTAASLVIIAGTITLVIGFVGCCGAIAENKCMMVVVSFHLMILKVVFKEQGMVVYKNWPQNFLGLKYGLIKV